MRKRRRFGMGALKRKNVAIAAALLTTESDAATESQGSCAQSPSATPRRCAVSLHRRRHTEVSTKHKEAARKSQHCIHSATQRYPFNYLDSNNIHINRPHAYGVHVLYTFFFPSASHCSTFFFHLVYCYILSKVNK